MTHKEYLKKVGIEIKVARIRKELTHKQLAKLTGMNESTFSLIEAGNNDVKLLTLKRIADALTMPITDFFTFNP
jgi:transcriptional regulator with XRE-family HTH domain